MIGLDEAAQLLGYSVSGLRKIVDRSRRRLRGEPVVRPMIQFFQAGPKAPIKFKPQWVDDFIRQHTGDPSRNVPQPNRVQRTPVAAPNAELVPPDVGESLGFDPTLYDV
jgi:hypothetical protein